MKKVAKFAGVAVLLSATAVAIGAAYLEYWLRRVDQQ